MNTIYWNLLEFIGLDKDRNIIAQKWLRQDFDTAIL